MLTHPTLDQLNQLGLFSMAKAFGEVAASGDVDWRHPSARLPLLRNGKVELRPNRNARSRDRCG